MCADSQETVGEYLKVFKPKLVELPLVSDDLKAVVVGSGNGDFIDAIVERVSERLDLVPPQIADAKHAVQIAVGEVCDAVWPHYSTQADKPTAKLLIGIRGVDGLTLLDIAAPIVKNADRYAFIGWGGDLATYKARQLVLAGMPVAVAAPITAYILDVVKKNVEYCGGDTHLAIISADGVVERKSQEFINSASQGYENTAWAVETFIIPIIAIARMPDGKDCLSAIAELGKPDPELTSQVGDVVSTLLSNRDKEGAEGGPELNPKSIALLAMTATALWKTTIDNLHKSGALDGKTYETAKQRLELLSNMALAAKTVSEQGNQEMAKKILMASARSISEPEFAVRLIANLPAGLFPALKG
jgi:hypothetical protein